MRIAILYVVVVFFFCPIRNASCDVTSIAFRFSRWRKIFVLEKSIEKKAQLNIFRCASYISEPRNRNRNRNREGERERKKEQNRQQLLLELWHAAVVQAQAHIYVYNLPFLFLNAFLPSINDRLRETNVTNCHCKFPNNKNDVGFVKPFRSSSFFFSPLCVCVCVCCASLSIVR